MLIGMRLRSNTGRDRSGLTFHVMKESIAIQNREAAVRAGLVTDSRGTEIGPDIQFHKDLHLVVWRPRGILDETAVNKVLVDLLRREAMAAKPFNRFSDLSVVESFHLTFKYVFSRRSSPASFLCGARAGEVRVLCYGPASCPSR